MSKNTIIWIVVAVVVLLGIWYFWSQGSGMQSPTATSSEETTDTGVTDVTSAHTVSDVTALAAHGANFTCSVNTTTTAGSTSGTIYASNMNTRFDLVIKTADGVSLTTHTIRKGSIAYTWTDGQSSGTKSTVTASTPVVSAPSGGVISTDVNGSIASDCHAWLPDQTQFVPPASITFVAQ